MRPKFVVAVRVWRIVVKNSEKERAIGEMIESNLCADVDVERVTVDFCNAVLP